MALNRTCPALEKTCILKMGIFPTCHAKNEHYVSGFSTIVGDLSPNRPPICSICRDPRRSHCEPDAKTLF